MKKRFTILTAFLLTGFLSASNVSAQVQEQYTLQQCVDYALQHYNDIKNAELDIQSAAAKIGEVRGAGLPKIAGKASLTDNPQLPRSFFDGGNELISSNPALAGLKLQPGTVYAFPNTFQVPTSGDMSMTLSQIIFDGSYIMGLKAASVYKDLVSKSLTQTKIQVVENVQKAFYLVLINNERLALLKTNVLRLDSSLANSKSFQKEGYVESIDVNRMEVARNNIASELTKFNEINDVTLLLLKYQMGMPMEVPLTLEGNVKEIQVQAIDKNAVSIDPKNRIEYSLLKTQLQLQNLDVKNNKAKFLPTLSGFATGGYSRSDDNVAKTLTGTWYNYALWGFNLNVPIIEGGSKIYRVKQARYQYLKAENNLNFFAQTVDLQVKQSVVSLNNEIQNLEIQRRNLELAQRVVKAARVKYAAGVGSNLEVIDAENAYKESQTNFYNSIYNTLLAKIQYQKSTGTLYND